MEPVHKQGCVADQIKVETQWNVNVNVDRAVMRRPTIKVETQWNVNPVGWSVSGVPSH